MEGIRRMSAFLVDYARNNTAPVQFPEDPKRKGTRKTGSGNVVLAGSICPVCGKGQLTENSKAFGCTERGCHCTVWKDCLVRGGGPEITGKLMSLLLEKKQLQGSTGILILKDGRILFYPNGSSQPSVNRSLIYQK